MKVRNILIGLLVVLMAFVFISCEDEPEEPAQPDTTQEVVYTLSAKAGVGDDYYGNDKPRLVFDDLVNEGDTLSFQFRSERDVYQFDIRNGNGKWVYQQDSSALTSYEVGDDGWITVTYTFGSTWYDGGAVSYGDNGQEGFDVRFRGRYFKGDLFEVKNVKINDTIIPLKEGDSEGFTLKGFELAAADAVFSNTKTYAVVYSVARAGDDDEAPLMEKVASGAKPVAANLEKEGFELEIFTQYDDKNKTQTGYVEESKITLDQLKDMVIEEDTIIYLKYTGVPRTVTFMNGEVQHDQKTVANGSSVAKPATDPEKAGGYQFAAWCSDSGLETEFNFAETPITADTILYAKYDKVWTVSFSLNGKAGTAPDDQIIIDGQKATAPATNPKTSGFRFQNWKLSSAVFDFDTPITADIELVADWTEAETVTFTYNYNYPGADPASFQNTGVFVDEPAEEPEDPERGGYCFLGWFSAAEGGTEYTFEEDVTEAKTLYAHWAEKITKMTLTVGDGSSTGTTRLDLRFNGEYAQPAAGDIVTFKYRTNATIADVCIREAAASAWKLLYWGKLASHVSGPDENGWITFSFEFPENTDEATPKAVNYTEATGFRLEFGAASGGDAYFNTGDYLEIKGLTFKGLPLEIVGTENKTGSSHGPYKSESKGKCTTEYYPDI